MLEVLPCPYAALGSVGRVTEQIEATQAGEGK
jgi:hypothetical protein